MLHVMELAQHSDSPGSYSSHDYRRANDCLATLDNSHWMDRGFFVRRIHYCDMLDHQPDRRSKKIVSNSLLPICGIYRLVHSNEGFKRLRD